MKVIAARNVHEVLPVALSWLDRAGIQRGSRNGPVLVSPDPVTTLYEHPEERVLFHPARDANPFFHLYESLWMIAGDNRIEPLLKYVSRIKDYSDDGETLHDAYGYRWRRAFKRDQLEVIVRRLRDDPEDRRCVLQMWDTRLDLDRNGKALPCNMTATFQIGFSGALDLTVFCRSNDIIWGAYGANAVQFGALLEYMAMRIGCPIGRYWQISVNWHAYLSVLLPLQGKIEHGLNPYACGTRMNRVAEVDGFDAQLYELFIDVDSSFKRWKDCPTTGYSAFFLTAYRVLMAHERWRSLARPESYAAALEALRGGDQSIDWIRAATEWVLRRKAAWEQKVSR